MTPFHKHDCKVCRYLGSTTTGIGTEDWYIHGDSIIARSSDEGSDYWSSLIAIAQDDKYMEAVCQGSRRTVYVGMFILARYMLQQAGIQPQPTKRKSA